jgi:multiple sugar transport system substrate-binding protein
VNIDAYRSGQVAMQMNFAFIWPGVEADDVGGGRFLVISRTHHADSTGQFAQLGGQGISVVF